ncbi:hypothetical protein ZHAS_00006724 [Anopheles sinensis]|uniref:Uncharacterized protein n=1 Tax=Anopheles sinensis TaxID=74873 RepID=A0A084VM21_ANOSI|nr:hypothetical protein ZHAS_00006724 [Anopheles sinensis]
MSFICDGRHEMRVRTKVPHFQRSPNQRIKRHDGVCRQALERANVKHDKRDRRSEQAKGSRDADLRCDNGVR